MMPQIILIVFPGIWGTEEVVFEIVRPIGRGHVKSGCKIDGMYSLLIFYVKIKSISQMMMTYVNDKN